MKGARNKEKRKEEGEGSSPAMYADNSSDMEEALLRVSPAPNESAAAPSSSAPPVVTRVPAADEPGAAAATADAAADGSSAEEMAARRALVQGLEGSRSPDEAAFAQAVQAADMARAQLQAKHAGTPVPGATLNRPRLTPSPPTGVADGSTAAAAEGGVGPSRNRSGSNVGDAPGLPPLGLLAARRPSLARQPSAPEMMSSWESQSSSPPRDTQAQQLSGEGGSVALAAQAVGSGVGLIPSRLTASPAFGPRHQSLPDLTALPDGGFEVIEGASGADGAKLRQAEPTPFNHLAQRPSLDMFAGPPRRTSFSLAAVAGGGGSGSGGGGGGGSSMSRKLSNSSSSINPLYEPLLSSHDASAAYPGLDPSSPSSSYFHTLPSPTTQDESLKRSRDAELAHHNKGLGRRQLRAMLHKNWLLKRRNPIQFACELLSPLCMVMVIVIGWLLSLSHVSHNGVGKFANNSASVEEIFHWVSRHIVPIEPPSPPEPPVPLTAAFDLDFSGLGLDEQPWRQQQDEPQLQQAYDPSEPRHALRQRNRRRLHASSDEEWAPASPFTDVHPPLDDPAGPVDDAMDDSWSYFSALHSGNSGDGNGNGEFYPYLHAKRRAASSSSSAAAASHRVGAVLPTADGDTCFPLDALPGEQFCYTDSEGKDVVEKILRYSGPMHVPHFDEFVSTHLVLQRLLQNATDSTFAELQDDLDQLDQYTNGKLANIIYLGKLLFAPDVPQVRALVQHLNETYRLFGRVFSGVEPTEAAAVARSKQHVRSDSDRTWAIVVFNQLHLDEGVLDYTIRMNSSVLPTTHSVVDKFQQGLDEDYKSFFWSGFLTLQIMVEEAALGVSAAAPGVATGGGGGMEGFHLSSLESDLSEPWLFSPPLNPSYSLLQTLTAIPFPVPAYDGNKFYSSVGPIVGLVLCMSMLYPTSRLIKGIVEEKETKTKETMKMMGLKDWVFHMSWFLTFLLQFLLTLTLLVVLLHFTMLPRAEVSFLWFLFLCFGLSQLSLGFLMTVFFSKAKLAGILGPILLFAATMPRYAFYSSDASSDASASAVWSKTFVSILSPTAFTFGADLLMKYEGAGLSFGWSNLADDTFSMGRVLGFLLVDFALYMLLAWYLDAVLPNDYGQREHPLFLCKRAYWKQVQSRDFDEEEDERQSRSSEATGAKGASSSSSAAAATPAAIVEPVPASMHSKARVRITNLRKQFTEGRGADKRVTTAVNGLDLTLYEGQITALLGHNGAGKSTSISMLTGLIAPTSGDCSIHGYSILKHMKEIRKSLGICPQQNVLFPKLSVTEHLRLYGTLKGVKDDELEAEVARKVDEVGLADKKDIYSSALSGGMQRKLQCAMAFIGDSKVVFLDEPTSGMDPYSRRSTWELLRNAKKDRVIVLTTHFMDEADLLGDRIAIMSEGRLRCVGSSLFLKSKYGIGYNLTLVKASKACRTEQVSKMVMFFCPDARILSTAGGEMSYRLPWSSVGQFPGLFQQLEERRHTMGIGGYGISQTTLEEVFMRCAHLDEGKDGEEGAEGQPMRKSSFGSRAASRKVSSAGGNATHPRDTHSPVQGAVAALSPASDTVKPPVSGIPSSLDTAADQFASASSSAAVPVPFPVPSGRYHASLGAQFRATIIKRYTCARRDLSGRFFEILLPVVVIALVLLILKLNTPSEGRELLMKAELFNNPPGVHTPLWVSRQSPQTEPATLWSMDRARGVQPEHSLLHVLQTNYTDSSAMTDALMLSERSHNGHRYGALVYNDTLYSHFNSSASGGGYAPGRIFETHPPLSIMHNTTFFQCMPVLVAEVAQARWNANRWRAYAESHGGVPPPPSNVSQVSYQLRNNPLPLTAHSSLKTKTYLTLFAALFMLIPFCYLPASFVLFVVRERTVKSKHLQFISGLSPNIYWAATYLWDLLQYTLIVACVMIVMGAYHSEAFVGSSATTGATLMLLMLYGMASIPLCYCYSFAFSNNTSAQVGIAGLNFITGFLLVIASFMLDQISSTQDVNAQLKAVYRIFPTFALGETLTNLSMREFNAFIHHQPVLSPFAWGVAGRNLTYLALEVVAYVLLTLALESNKLHRAVRLLFNLSGELADPGPEVVKDEDVDVAAERRRVQRMRVKVVRTNSDGTSFVGLSSPITPGTGLRGLNTPATGSAGASAGAGAPTGWAGAPSLNSERSVDSVMMSPYQDHNSSNGGGNGVSARPVTLPTPGNFSTLAEGGGDGIRSPLLGYAERNASEAEEKRAVAANWPDAYPKPPSMSLELTPSPLDQRSVSEAARGAPENVSVFPTLSRPPLHSPIDEHAQPHPHASPSSAATSSDGDDILTLQHLRKVYPARGGGKVTVAVQNLSLGIPRGQVFGFLGINGAGKTTTMKMLTGDLPISKGRAFISGFSVTKQLPQVRKEIGYCPQFDPLLPDLTSREQLTMFARFHGLPESTIPDVVQKLLNTLGLSRFADKQCGTYSGGNKRKLSLAIALIGNPSVVFLDEPSTGMDPVSRRFMWSVIESISDGRSVILTTHSMEECEALASRVGVMVGGALQCLGSIQHLKSRFGSGYLMEINAHESSVGAVKAFVRRMYPQSQLDQQHGGRLKYRLAQQGLTLSSVFSQMEANKKALAITDYSISQCSLETIFINQVAKTKGGAEPGASP